MVIFQHYLERQEFPCNKRREGSLNNKLFGIIEHVMDTGSGGK